MTEPITSEQVVRAIERVAARLIEIEDELNQLDAAMGDGDMGITIARGATGLRDWIAQNPPGDDLGKFLAGAGMAFNRIAPSTMGTLTATALMRAGKEARGLASLDGPALARMLTAVDDGIRERGKAQPGDKTIVDALHPAAEALASAIAAGQDLATASQAMLQAARAGRDAAIPLRSKIGRASWVGERTAGHPDPGTVMLVQILETLMGAEYSQPGTAAPA